LDTIIEKLNKLDESIAAMSIRQGESCGDGAGGKIVLSTNNLTKSTPALQEMRQCRLRPPDITCDDANLQVPPSVPVALIEVSLPVSPDKGNNTLAVPTSLKQQNQSPTNQAPTKRNKSVASTRPFEGMQSQPKGPFLDAEAMKKKLRDDLADNDYNVFQFYHETGVCQAIATSRHFEYVTLGVITLNAAWITFTVQTYNNLPAIAESPIEVQVFENLFCTYFFGEWLIRFASFEIKMNGFRDAWFVFDSALVLQAIVETWLMYMISAISGGATFGIFSVFTRLLRIARMCRVIRLLREMPELLILLRGIALAFRGVFFSLVLCLVASFMISVVLTELSKDYQAVLPEYPGVFVTLRRLMVYTLVPDLVEQVEAITQTKDYLVIFVFAIFLALCAITIMHVMTAIIVEVISTVAVVEKEKNAIALMKRGLESYLLSHDMNLDGRIGLPEFSALLQDQSASMFLTSVGVDVVWMVDQLEIAFKNDRTYSYGEIVGLVLDCRQDNASTIKDIVGLQRWLHGELQELHGIIRARGDEIQKMIINVWHNALS
jgi:hypothetical protein